MSMDAVRDAARKLASNERGHGHGGHRGEHAPAECRYCAEWTLAVLELWAATDQQYGPRTVILAVIDNLKETAKEVR